MSNFETFLTSIAPKPANARIIGLINFKNPAESLKQIKNLDERRFALRGYYQEIKMPVVEWLNGHLQARVTNQLEGSPTIIVAATKTCWQELVKACAEGGEFHGAITDIAPNDVSASA